MLKSENSPNQSYRHFQHITPEDNPIGRRGVRITLLVTNILLTDSVSVALLMSKPSRFR